MPRICMEYLLIIIVDFNSKSSELYPSNRCILKSFETSKDCGPDVSNAATITNNNINMGSWESSIAALIQIILFLNNEELKIN